MCWMLHWMKLDFIPWAQILRTPSLSSACPSFSSHLDQPSFLSENVTALALFLHASLCHPSSGFCTTPLCHQWEVPWQTVQWCLCGLAFPILLVLISVLSHCWNYLCEILSSLGFQEKSHLGFFSCLFLSAFGGGCGGGGSGRKGGLFLFLCCPYIVDVLQDNLLIPSFLSTHFVYAFCDVKLHPYPGDMSLISFFYATLFVFSAC